MAASTDPKSVQVNVSTGAGMEIEWKDGHLSSYKFPYLRNACPCALCNEERPANQKPGSPPAPKPGALPMFKEPARAKEAKPVGNYAISFVWNDGHEHGIYSWEYLRYLCPCSECQSAKPAGDGISSSPGHPSVK